MTITKLWKLALLMGLALNATHAWAAFSCGDVVSGHVTLTNDVICAFSGQQFITGLAVGADDTTIDLNGHTISCTGPGFGGSCQSSNTYNGTTTPKAAIAVGIVGSHKNVQINGPGTVTGFGTDIRLNFGPGLQINNVTVTGPDTPDFASNTREFGAGIVIALTTCAGGDAAVVKSNDVSNVAQGIQLSSAQCVTVLDNNIHNNASATDNTPGIVLLDSSNNTINKNMVHGNGAGFFSSGNPAGAIQVMNSSTGNTVVNNTVVSNCTNGIAAFDAPFASGTT